MVIISITGARSQAAQAKHLCDTTTITRERSNGRQVCGGFVIHNNEHDDDDDGDNILNPWKREALYSFEAPAVFTCFHAYIGYDQIFSLVSRNSRGLICFFF